MQENNPSSSSIRLDLSPPRNGLGWQDARCFRARFHLTASQPRKLPARRAHLFPARAALAFPALSLFHPSKARVVGSPKRQPTYVRCAPGSVGMASVFWGGGRADEVADFDEYDPTPYGGGYDLALTFGRALPPSDETCYPISTSSASSCGRPQYGRRPEAEGSYGAAEQHRRRPQAEESHGSAGYGGGGGGYGRRPHAQEKESHGSSAGYGYGRKAHDDDEGAEAHGSVYRKPKPAYGDERPKYQGGDGDERPSYGRKKHDDDDSDGERKPRYKKHDDDDSDDERKPRYKKHDDDDSDDEKKQRYGKSNRRRQDYDD